MPIVIIRQKILVGVEHQNFGQLRQDRIDGMNVQRSKPGGEAHLRRGSQRLLAEKQRLVINQQPAQPVHHRGLELLREIDPLDQCTDLRRDARYFDVHGPIVASDNPCRISSPDRPGRRHNILPALSGLR